MAEATETRHGLTFDTGVLASGLGLAITAPTWLSQPAGPVGGALLLAAFALHVIGSGCKVPFLRARLAGRCEPLPVWTRRLLVVLLFLHFLFFTVVIVMAFLLLGWAGEQGWDADWFWIPLAFALAGGACWQVQQVASPQGSDAQAAAFDETGDPQPFGTNQPLARSGCGEWLADGLLWVSVLLLGYLFWDGLLHELENVRGIGFGARSVVLLASLSILMLFLYLPMRYLFLVEDAHSPWTWLRIWLTVMLPVGWLLLVG